MRISGRTKIAELAASKINLAELLLVTNSKYSSLKNQHHAIMKLRTCKVLAGVAPVQLHFYHDIYINKIYTQLFQDRKHDVRQSLLIL